MTDLIKDFSLEALKHKAKQNSNQFKKEARTISHYKKFLFKKENNNIVEDLIKFSSDAYVDFEISEETIENLESQLSVVVQNNSFFLEPKIECALFALFKGKKTDENSKKHSYIGLDGLKSGIKSYWMHKFKKNIENPASCFQVYPKAEELKEVLKKIQENTEYNDQEKKDFIYEEIEKIKQKNFEQPDLKKILSYHKTIISSDAEFYVSKMLSTISEFELGMENIKNF